MKYKIISIGEKPWWKIWRVANWEVIVEAEGQRRMILIYTSTPSMITHYLKNKIERGSQWSNKRPKVNPEIEKLIGKELECEE